MSNKHTPEPWIVMDYSNSGTKTCIYRDVSIDHHDCRLITQTQDFTFSDDIREANAQRIVQCVNVLSGKNIPAILALFEMLETEDYDHVDDVVQFYNEYVCDITGKYEALFPTKDA